MRLPKPSLPPAVGVIAVLVQQLVKYLVMVQTQVNAMSSGSVSAIPNAAIQPPTAKSTQTYAQGDFVRNSAPVESGTAGSKYIVTGWVCVNSGPPAIWVESRSLTGN